MYTKNILKLLKDQISELKKAGRFKEELILSSAQSPHVKSGNKNILMFASNNYLGLANHPEIIESAKKSLDQLGFGLSSVRFISGTTVVHKNLERKISAFLKAEDAILFSSCFSANEAFLAAFSGVSNQPTVVYSDELNHASIIDGLKLAKSDQLVKKIYPHNNVAALESMLLNDAKSDFKHRLIVTDGVFSMEGELAYLPSLVKLAKKFQALLFVDDSHGLGACGKTGRGSIEELGILGKIDVISGTFSKAIGGAGGGFLAGKKEMIEFLRQKSRPYIFSNSLAPAIVQGSSTAIDIIEKNPKLIAILKDNALYFRQKIKTAGFRIIEGSHPIVPIMIFDSKLTQKISQQLLKKGLYAVGLWFPVVPEGKARLRLQISAAHSKKDLDKAIDILIKTGKELCII